MKSKLTLSLPEKTIKEAKKIAKIRHTTVSTLFAESLTFWKTNIASQRGEEMAGQNTENSMHDLLGAFSAKTPFDERSSRIREKHG